MSKFTELLCVIRKSDFLVNLFSSCQAVRMVMHFEEIKKEQKCDLHVRAGATKQKNCIVFFPHSVLRMATPRRWPASCGRTQLACMPATVRDRCRSMWPQPRAERRSWPSSWSRAVVSPVDASGFFFWLLLLSLL